MKKWKIYFFVMASVDLIILLNAIRKPELLNLVDLCTSTFALVALFGFSYRRKIFISIIWKISFILCAFAETINGVIQLSINFKPRVLIGVLALSLIFVLPIYYAFYQYSFGKKSLWNIKKLS